MIDNFSKIVVRTFHATPSTVVVRAMPSPQNSRNRYPAIADVRVGTIYGASQYEQQEYVTGTMPAGAGGGRSGRFRVIPAAPRRSRRG